MFERTVALLDAFEGTEWFANVGRQTTDRCAYVEGWPEAVEIAEAFFSSLKKGVNVKSFKLSREQIVDLVVDRRGCLATDRIVVDGARVGYMYREDAHNSSDSGWRFFAGDENSAYMSDAALHGVYTLNTLANYDPRIVPFLEMPVGTQIEEGADGELGEVAP